MDASMLAHQQGPTLISSVTTLGAVRMTFQERWKIGAEVYLCSQHVFMIMMMIQNTSFQKILEKNKKQKQTNNNKQTKKNKEQNKQTNKQTKGFVRLENRKNITKKREN